MSLLTITRRAGERILIGEDIVVLVQEVRKSQVRLSIDAPADVRIDRAELRAKILDNRRLGRRRLAISPDRE